MEAFRFGEDVQLLSESGDKPVPQWAVVGLLSILLVSVAAFVVVFVRSTASSSSIRSEAEKEVLLADMDAAVQVQSEHAGQFVASMDPNTMDPSSMNPASGMDEPGVPAEGVEGMDHGAMDIDGMAGEMVETAFATGSNQSPPSVPTGSSDALLAHRPEVLAAAASFGQAAGGLRQLTPASEQGLLDDAVATHTAFTASIDARSHGESGAMSFYHGDTQVVEATLRSSLQALQQSSRESLQSAIAQARSAETLLRVALPIILITGLMATIYLLGTRAMRRRVATLESLVTAKDEFIGAVSHELRTPLTGIVGFADLLHQAEETLTVPQRAAMVASISEQSHELSSIIEDLLVAARAEIGELTIINVTVDLRAQTPLVLETVQPQLPGIELVGAAPATVVGDPVRVRNNGPAIAHQDRERIFEPYQRAHNNPGLPGSIGLGLAVSRRLARLMGGDLTYHHRDDTSIFELTLRLATATESAVPDAVEFAAN